ncbi:MAG: ABC transporter ATP-binding protein [Rhizobiaceae bacterium]|nr:ABC transporter ATP-binding protein [Rhizobiaceae bacterium]
MSETVMPAAQPEGPVLEVSDLTVTFPGLHGGATVTAVDRASFVIGRGETLGLVGQSGSGKTTTGRAVLQLQKVTSGSVRLLGRELVGMGRKPLREMRRHMQFVQQNPYSSLHPRLTIGRILSEPLEVHRTVSRARIRERIVELLELVNMDPKVVDRYPHEFSGGQRQRIVIARALAVNPDFVVCDEAVSALDVRTQAQIVTLLQGLQERLGLSYLFVAHDLAIVREMAHRVAVMYSGQIVELGPSAAVYDSPGHAYTRLLLDSIPVPDPAIQRLRLRNPLPDVRFVDSNPGPCAHAEDHATTGTAPMHMIGPDHCVSCRFQPQPR